MYIRGDGTILTYIEAFKTHETIVPQNDLKK